MTGDVPTSALQCDPRFQYAAYIPDAHYPQAKDEITKLPVLVTVHGTSRTHLRYMNIWRDFADSHRCAIIAPLFPCMVSGPTDIDGYHYLGRRPPTESPMHEKLLKKAVNVPDIFTRIEQDYDVRHDKILLALLDEVALRWPALDVSKIMLAGFSGGAQFVHRFMYLYPERTLAVSIGDPGSITDLDPEKAWPAGTKDTEMLFGRKVDSEMLKRVPVLASVGSEEAGDKMTARLLVKNETYGTQDDPNRTRAQKFEECVQRWRDAGLNVDFEIVPGAKHEMEKVHVAVEPFMIRHVTNWRREHTG